MFTKRVESSLTYSYTGLVTAMGFNIGTLSDELCAGPRISVTYYSRYSKIPAGFFIDYKRNIGSKNKLRSFANIFYGNIFMNIFSPINAETGTYQAHELYLGYGIQWIAHHLVICNIIAFGGYLENQKNFYSETPLIFKQFGPLVKIALAYQF